LACSSSMVRFWLSKTFASPVSERCHHIEHGHSHGGHSHDEESAESPRSISEASTPLSPEDSSPHTRTKSISRPRGDSFNSLYGHPAQTRAMVIETAHEFGYGRPQKAHSEVFSPSSSYPGEGLTSPQRSRSIGARGGSGDGRMDSLVERSREGSSDGNNDIDHDHAGHDHSHAQENGKVITESGHTHSPDEASGGGGHGHGGHGHGSMNMKGVFLHVLGDALGNVGVIAAGLVIML
jgi:solute carrier family 30 (zinc transporter), member 1